MTQRYNAASIFKRAHGSGRITALRGPRPPAGRVGPAVAAVDLLPVGAPRRDWRATLDRRRHGRSSATPSCRSTIDDRRPLRAGAAPARGVGCGHDHPTCSALVGAQAAAGDPGPGVRAGGAGRARGQHPRPAVDGAAAGPARGVRLHRRRGRGRDQPAAGSAGLRRGRVPAARAARRLRGRRHDRGAGQAVDAAAGAGPDGLHADDAHRGRAGGGAGRRQGGRALRAVDDGDHLDRGRGGRGPRRPALVPALRVAGPQGRRGPRRPRPSRPATRRWC